MKKFFKYASLIVAVYVLTLTQVIWFTPHHLRRGVNNGLRDDQNQSSKGLLPSQERRHTEAKNTSEGLSNQTRKQSGGFNSLPTIYVVTPTYRRPNQLPEVTRMANTLKHVKNLFWILREDSPKLNEEIIDLLKFSGLNHSYQIARRPTGFGLTQGRGVAGRKSGIEWIRTHATDGVMYFADDDNTYDIRLFEEMRYTKKVSMWPVGSFPVLGVSTPIVKGGKVVGFYDVFKGGRKFQVDMAGFAVGIPFLLQAKNIDLPYRQGQIETKFLESLGVKLEDIEVKAENCTKVYVWHTQTKSITNARRIDFAKWNGRGTNLERIEKAFI